MMNLEKMGRTAVLRDIGRSAIWEMSGGMMHAETGIKLQLYAQGMSTAAMTDVLSDNSISRKEVLFS